MVSREREGHALARVLLSEIVGGNYGKRRDLFCQPELYVPSGINERFTCYLRVPNSKHFGEQSRQPLQKYENSILAKKTRLVTRVSDPRERS
jgi:hypothetical protein